jgi:hypothetical protein
LHGRLDRAGLFTSHGEVISDGYVRFLGRAVIGSFGPEQRSVRG